MILFDPSSEYLGPRGEVPHAVGPMASPPGEARARRRRPAPLRIGIINIMPRAESYEPYLSRPLADSTGPIDLAWIRLESHTYSSSDRAHIARDYRTYAETLAMGALDGLILTGAPVEELPFEQVTYWPELTRILTHVRREVRSTLGLCWGGLALARQLGIEKRLFSRKLFGVFENRNLSPAEGLLGGEALRFWCAHSRHSGIDDDELERAREAGLVRLLSHSGETGYSVFETPDHRFVMHLGHPEYEPARLIEEWQRDARLGRADVDPPRSFDLGAPIDTWQSHRTVLFSQWLSIVAEDASQPRGRQQRTSRQQGGEP